MKDKIKTTEKEIDLEELREIATKAIDNNKAVFKRLAEI
jgi:hypothetical protein